MRLKRFTALFAILVVILSSGVANSSKAPINETTFYEVKMRSLLGNMGTRKMYYKNSNFAWEMQSGDLNLRLIKNEDGVFMLHPFGRYAAKYPPGTTRESPMAFLPGPIGKVKDFLELNDAEKLKEEKANGVECEVYYYVEKKSGWKCTLWVQKSNLKPIKLLMETDKKEDAIRVEYLAYRVGGFIGDSRFALPEDIPIRDMPDRFSEAIDLKSDETEDGEKSDAQAEKDIDESDADEDDTE